MKNINDILNKVELERNSDKITLKAKISPEFYGQILKAFFSYTGIIEDTLNGKKRYISDIGTFSYYQLGYGHITKFNGQIVEIGENSEEFSIVVTEENNIKTNEKDEDSIANIYENAKSGAQIDIYMKTSIKKAEKFLNYMETSLFDNVNLINEDEEHEKEKHSFSAKNLFKKNNIKKEIEEHVEESTVEEEKTNINLDETIEENFEKEKIKRNKFSFNKFMNKMKKNWKIR